MQGQRMAPHTPEESPQVKTKCVRIGSCRLYAPMVPLAPHPCVRWWNTKEITLKLTRLCLHSLRGGFSHQKPSHPRRDGCPHPPTSPNSHPPRRRGYQRTGSGIPPTQRQWRKRTHGSLKPTPPEPKGIPQSSSPEGYHNSTNLTLGCTVARNYFHRSTFSFSESRTAFSFALQKKKWFWPPLGKRKNNPQPGRQKTNCKVKTPRFPTKEKAVLPAGGTPHP